MDLKFNGVKVSEKPDPQVYHIGKFVRNIDIIPNEEFCLKIPQREIILDQAWVNSCVGHSYAMAKSILEYSHNHKWIEFSPSAIYGTRENGAYLGQGMYLDQGASVLRKEGAFLRRDFHVEEDMPELMDTLSSWKLANPDKVKLAKDFVISGYGAADSVEEIKQYLLKGMPVVAIWPVLQSLYDAPADGMVSGKYSSKIYGYHCMTIVGWRSDNRWIVVNSWGTSGGMKGLYYIPFVYPLDSAMAISDNIFPAKVKAEKIELQLNSKIYYVDNEKKESDVAVIELNDRTYVPVRIVAEALGAKVEWDEATQRVTITSEEAEIKMNVGSLDFLIDGNLVHNDVAPVELEDRVRLPIRIIAEALNCNVTWKEDEQKVIIESK